MEYEIVLTGILIVMLVFIATFESAFGQLSDVSLRSLSSESKSSSRARFLRHLVEHHQLFWLTVLSGLQFSAVSIALLITSTSIKWGLPLPQALLVSFAGSMFFGAVFGQILPRLFTQNNPVRALLLLLPVFAVYYRVFSVPAQIVYKLLRRFRKNHSLTPEAAIDNSLDDKENIQALIDVGTEEGIIEEAESKLIHSVIEFTDTKVKEVMTPRTEMIVLDINATIEELRDLMIDRNHSRLPVYRDSIDNIEGVVYIRDVMAAWRSGATKGLVGSIAKAAYFIPETKLVAELLTDMQRTKRQIALVVDEYGVTAGLVTIKDLIEEIVGEIEQEETDKNFQEEPDIIDTKDGSYLVKGSTEIRKVEVLFDKEIGADDFSTIAGFITKNAGRVPSVDELLSYHGINVTILEVDNGRIGRVRLSTSEDMQNHGQQLE